MITEIKERLTAREEEVLRHVAAGKANKRIARDLCISEATVENHLTNIYRKWAVGNRTEAAVRAIRLGIPLWE